MSKIQAVLSDQGESILQESIEEESVQDRTVLGRLSINPAANPAAEHDPVQVDIFVAEGCYACGYSKEVAARIRDDFPGVQVRLLDIADPDTDLPDAVFATPTYLLNGKLWSLGNPSPRDVTERLTTALADRE